MVDHNICIWAILMMVAIGWQTTFALDTPEDADYGVLIDAGSSSSKAKIYKWNHPNDVMSAPVVKLVKDKRFKPPISRFSGDSDGLGAHLDSILEWIKGVIPSSRHRTTPILVMATAGMRLLEPQTTQEIMTGVRQVLSNATRNPFAPMEEDDVSVLSGEEEGAYAWMATNYLLGFFDGNKSINKSVGVLEMGGGSTQIAFIPDGPLYDGEFQLKFGGRRYSLYVHSYLNLGASAIHREIVHELLNGKPNVNIEEPCMLKGDNKTMSMGHGNTVQVFGSGDANACWEVLNDILEPLEEFRCQPKPCSIRNVYQPDVGNLSFYATQTFNYAPNYLNGVRPDGTLDIENLISTAVDFCSLTLEEARAGRKDRKKYVSSDCLMGNYIPVLLENYGFSLNTKQIKLATKIKSQSIDWAVGAMLVKLSDRFTPNQSVVCPTRAGNGASRDGNSIIGKTAIVLMSLMVLF